MAPVNPATGGGAFGLWLLTDGTVLSHGNGLNHWEILTPDKTGSYIKGTWKAAAASVHARSGATQHVLKDGRFFQAGGEFIDGPACTTALCNTAEVYDPVANTWTNLPNGLLDIGDTGSATLADGRLLYSNRFTTATEIYDPVANAWTMGPAMPRGMGSGDENAWASLTNGGVLAVDQGSAALYDPASNTWIATGALPANFDTGDTAGISQLFDGRVIAYGANAPRVGVPVVYIYTPGPTSTSPGTWAIGPNMIMGDGAEDEYTDVLTDGTVMLGVTAQSLGAAVGLQLFDPTTSTTASVAAPPDRGTPFPIDYVNLPNGQTMVTSGDNDWIYTPNSLPDDSWRPTVTSVAFNGGTTYTLTGTQISGLINGADEGDDMTMAENYPIVWLTDNSGNVFFCKSFNFSNMMPSKGSAPETTQFTTPAGLASGTYNLFVSSVGIQSKTAFIFTTGVGGTGDGGAGPTGGSSSSSGGSSSSGSSSGAARDAGADATNGGGDAGKADGGSSGGTASSSSGSGTASSSGSGGASSGGGTASSSGGSGTASSSGSGGASSGGGTASSSGGASSGGGDAGDTGNGQPSGCGCTTVGDTQGRTGAGWLLGLVGIAVATVRSRRRRSKDAT
jgi:MYXO-CTERM domain-containing protein